MAAVRRDGSIAPPATCVRRLAYWAGSTTSTSTDAATLRITCHRPFRVRTIDYGFRSAIEWATALEAHGEIEKSAFTNYMPDNMTEQVQTYDYFFAEVFLDDGGEFRPSCPCFGRLHSDRAPTARSVLPACRVP